MSQELGPVTRLIQYLPAVYQEPETETESQPPDVDPSTTTEPTYEPPFLDEYLQPYEEILLGLRDGDKSSPGLEYLVARLYRYLDPRTTPTEFLPWLAQWAALTLLSGVPEEKNRRLLARIIPLYRYRGTRRCLEELLEIVLDVPAEVKDDFPLFEIGRHSTIGQESWIGGGPSHFFQVILRFSRATGPGLQRQRQLAEYVIALAKPAHTDYALDVAAPRFQVGVYSTIAVDSFL